MQSMISSKALVERGYMSFVIWMYMIYRTVRFMREMTEGIRMMFSQTVIRI